MKNWLNQDIQNGDVVYRGARQGDSSSFRLGVIDLVNEEKNTARVKWHYESGSYTIWDNITYQRPYDDPNAYVIVGPREYYGAKGTSAIGTLVKMDSKLLEDMHKRIALCKLAVEKHIPRASFAKFEKDFMAGNLPF